MTTKETQTIRVYGAWIAFFGAELRAVQMALNAPRHKQIVDRAKNIVREKTREASRAERQ